MSIKFVIGKKEVLSKKIAMEFAKEIKKHPEAILLLPTGNSPIGIYQELQKKHKSGLKFDKLTTFNLDEYLDIDVNKNKLSFRNFMKEHLFDHVGIKHYHFPDTPKAYDAKLDKVKKFNLGMIGVGVNGHIAFNEPGALKTTRTNVVKLTKSTIEANFKGIKKYPTKAITMGMKDIIGKTDKLILIAWGESKVDALTKLVEGKVTKEWPITYLKGHKNLTIYTDNKQFKNAKIK